MATHGGNAQPRNKSSSSSPNSGSSFSNTVLAAVAQHQQRSTSLKHSKSLVLKNWYREVKDGLRSKLVQRQVSACEAPVTPKTSKPQLLKVSSFDPDSPVRDHFINDNEFRLKRTYAFKVRTIFHPVLTPFFWKLLFTLSFFWTSFGGFIEDFLGFNYDTLEIPYKFG